MIVVLWRLRDLPRKPPSAWHLRVARKPPPGRVEARSSHESQRPYEIDDTVKLQQEGKRRERTQEGEDGRTAQRERHSEG